MNKIGLLLIGACATVIAGCTASVDSGDTRGTVSTAPPASRGTFVPATEFVSIARTRQPVVVYGDTRGRWTYGRGQRVYFVSGGNRVRGRWYVRGDRYCTTYRGIPDRCYRVYRTSENRYRFYDDDNRVWARISF